MTEDTLMCAGTTLVRSRPEAEEESPWWLPVEGRPDRVSAPFAARRDEEEEEDEELEDEDDEDEEE